MSKNWEIFLKAIAFLGFLTGIVAILIYLAVDIDLKDLITLIFLGGSGWIVAYIVIRQFIHEKKNRKIILEMDLLVRLLYSNIGKKSNIFLNKKPNPNSSLYQPYINFWDGIKQNQYRAGTEDFHSAIENYLEYLDQNKNKTGRSYKEIRDELYKATEKRNNELEKLLK